MASARASSLLLRSGAAVASVGGGYLALREWNARSIMHAEAAETGAVAPIRCQDGTTVTPWAAPTRSEQIEKLKSEEFDVLVIGGGCVGAGVALEAASRGLKTALIERDDFAAGTSGRSTKLIHGGIRYLENAFLKGDYKSFALVTEALEERAHLLEAAPYMAYPLPIMIPLYTWWEVPYMWLGAKVYDLIAGKRRVVPASHLLSKDEAVYRFPQLDPAKLKGAVVYYDGMHNDTRMNLLIALTSAQSGAAIANYVQLDALSKDDKGVVCGGTVKDVLTGETFEIQSKAVVNATGPFTDAVRKMDDPETPEVVVPAGGVHVVLPDHLCPDHMGLIVPKTKDGRVLFFLPWEGSTLCGTTDSVTDLTMTPRPTDEEVGFILEEANRFLDTKVSRRDVKSSWSGIRPLVRDLSKSSDPNDTKNLSRSHVVEVTPSHLVSIMGGKWTTYRRMAEDTIDKLLQVEPTLTESASRSKTRHMQFLGADRAGIVVGKKFDRITVTLREQYGFDKMVANHLRQNYGTRALQIAEICRRSPKMKDRLAWQHPFIAAEVVFHVDQEYACTVQDVMARRTRLAFIDTEASKQALPRVVEIMAQRLRWSSQRQQEETENFLKFLDTMGYKRKEKGTHR